MDKLTPLVINQEAVSRLKCILTDPFYKDAIENSASFNTRVCLERKMRLPFLDAQTGVAQSDCFLWMQKWQRMPGLADGQLYTYPARTWRKKRRQYLMNDRYLARRVRDSDVNEADMHQISVVENTASRLEDGENGERPMAEDSKDSWYKDYEDGTEGMADIADVEDPETDFDDYEEAYGRKKKKKVNTTRKKRERIEYTDAEKPYSCEFCGARYKTRPGLSYHYSHSHNNTQGDMEPDENYLNLPPPKPVVQPPPPPAPVPQPPPVNLQQQQQQQQMAPVLSAAVASSSAQDDPLAGLKKFQDSFLTFLKAPDGMQLSNPACYFARQKSASGKPLANPSPYCDFCLGDSIENKKTKTSEELVSCSDCGRSAHPTCLQFTPNMTLSVRKYRWQCIECKSCGICGTSDHDDQLLFCDDCDRGYHMYCLSPPLTEPPEGSWSCHLCIEEYHTRK